MGVTRRVTGGAAPPVTLLDGVAVKTVATAINSNVQRSGRYWRSTISGTPVWGDRQHLSLRGFKHTAFCTS